MRPRLPALTIGAFLATASLALAGYSAEAMAQPTGSTDRPGIDRYPSWMLDADPGISGQDQDYRIWEDDRFDRLDPDFLAWRREQRRRYGPEWRSRPGYEADLRRWLEERE